MTRKPLPQYYDVLEVPHFADPQSVKAAYRRLVREHHPDLHPNDPKAEERFKAVNEAYETLGNPDKKKAYDLSLRMLKQLSPGSKQGSSSAPQAAKPGGQSGTKPNPAQPPKAAQSGKQGQAAQPGVRSGHAKPSSEAADEALSWDSLLGGIFNRGKKKAASSEGAGAQWKASQTQVSQTQASKTETSPAEKPAPKAPAPQLKRGGDITTQTFLSPEEAQRGCIQSVVLEQRQPCGTCSGSGKVNGRLCPSCNGEGTLLQRKRLEVRIPPGVKAGSKVRVAQEGAPSPEGGEPGDLYIEVQLQTGGALRVEGKTVYLDWPISLPLAVLGGEVKVPTLQGECTLVIPPGVSAGQVLRMKGLGVQGQHVQGDQLVTVQLQVPAKLNPEQQALYQALLALEAPASTPKPPEAKN